MIPGKFIQFSLLPESEAEQLAEKAWQNGHRRVGILAVDSPWGHRVASTFSRHWQSLGGQIVQTRFISSREDQTTTIQQFLGIRANQDLKEEPPTPSFDVVMMASDPLQARQLKPLLNFYYAEKIPVYATSSVYSGEPDPMTDHDLNGVIFCDMPWLVNSSRHPSLTATSPDRRLFALGADAYQLTMQIGILKSGKRYAGLTGDLFLVDQQIHRQLTWVKMVKGTPVERF